MTVRIPKWLIAVLGVVAILGLLATAFFLGRSSDDESPSASPTADANETTSTVSAETPQPPCTTAAAKDATLASDWPDYVRANPLSGLDPDPFFDPVAGFRKDQLECLDLTGDGNDEMVFTVNAGAAGRVFNWAIFSPDESGQWELAFHREGVLIDELTFRADTVVERQPTFGPDDPLCCPSGTRTSEIAWDGSEYKVETSAKSDDRDVLVDSVHGATQLGPLDLESASPLDAADAFGTPSSIAADGVICRQEWRDLGLVINFANLGGQDPCGPDARVGTVAIVGSAGEQAGWETEDGLRIGMTEAQLRELYPDATKEEVTGDLPPLYLNTDPPLALIEKSSPIGDAGTITVLRAGLNGGVVTVLELAVGAAGE